METVDERPASAASAVEIRRWGCFVGGDWVDADSNFSVESPCDGSRFADAADSDRQLAARAVDAAHAAAPDWGARPHHERAKLLLRVADQLEARRADVVDALIREGGSWFGKAMFETGYVADLFRAAAAAVYLPEGEVLPSSYGKLSLAVRRPLGVVTVISPWNFPLLLSSRGVAFALAAGNTVILKPSEETPVTGGLLLAELFAASDAPAGVFNVVTCSRDGVAEVGDELVANPKVGGVSFTGSTPVGRRIASKAGELLKPCCVELGGKDALIVLDDADLDRAVEAAAFGAFMHQGQICMAAERILVHESVADEFTQKFVAKTKTLKTGDPSADKGHVIGPIINARQVAKIKAQIEQALAEGATLEVGGDVDGLYLTPTILSGVTSGMNVFRQETFGPVAPITRIASDDEAVALANDCDYGLSSGVISRSESRALAIAHRLETGMCHVNCSPVNDEPHAPFGGVKGSGFGRHGGRWSIDAFSQTRWITLDRGDRRYPF